MDDHAFGSAAQLAVEIRDRRMGFLELLDFYLTCAERHNAALTGSARPNIYGTINNPRDRTRA